MLTTHKAQTSLGQRFDASTPLEAALAYAAAGIPIFPVSANKVPLCPGGFYDATTDPDIIIGWWTQRPFADIGMPTGKVSGYIVLDRDMKNGRNGFKAVPDMDLSPVMASSPSGGTHDFFAYADGIHSQHDQFAPGIEIKSDGAYVVLPSPGSGREWVKGSSLPADGLPPVPGHLVVPGGPSRINNVVTFPPPSKERLEKMAQHAGKGTLHRS